MSNQKGAVKSLSSGVSTDAKQILSVLSGLIVLMVFFTIAKPVFLSVNNLLTIALQTAIIAIIAIGQSYVIITTGIDLSIGPNMALSAIVAAMLMTSGVPVLLSVLAGLLVGTVCGFVNGFIIAMGNMPPFIVTMGTLSITRGICLVITEGIPVSGLPKSFTFFGSGYILGTENFAGIPVAVIIMAIIAVIFGLILAKTKLGRYTYAVGSNFEAARLSGINTKRVIISVYTISGLMAAAAGLILAGRIVSAQPTAGEGYELDAVASSVIGGVSQMGGEGMIVGTIIGAFIIGALRNGLNLMGVSAFWQRIAIGVVIIGAVYFDRLKRKN